MKRKLSTREWVLLAVLAVIALVSAYVMLFYIPTTTARDNALAETETVRDELEALQLRQGQKERMEREIDELFAQGAEPLALASYDNLQNVMLELNATLANAGDYNLSFPTVDASESVVRREISVSFRCDSYATAKRVLQQLHDSRYRSVLDTVAIAFARSDNNRNNRQEVTDPFAVSCTIVYFESRQET